MSLPFFFNKQGFSYLLHLLLYMFIYITGFGAFQGVSANPTQLLPSIVSSLFPPLFLKDAFLQEQRPSGTKTSSTRRLPSSLTAVVEICGTEVLKVSIDAVKEATPRIHNFLANYHQQILSTTPNDSSSQPLSLSDGRSSSRRRRHHLLVLHLGLDSSRNTFALETTAYNEAKFKVADDNGQQPEGEPINRACHHSSLQCTLPLDYRW